VRVAGLGAGPRGRGGEAGGGHAGVGEGEHGEGGGRPQLVLDV
jgi:hypothetical protein